MRIQTVLFLWVSLCLLAWCSNTSEQIALQQEERNQQMFETAMKKDCSENQFLWDDYFKKSKIFSDSDISEWTCNTVLFYSNVENKCIASYNCIEKKGICMRKSWIIDWYTKDYLFECVWQKNILWYLSEDWKNLQVRKGYNIFDYYVNWIWLRGVINEFPFEVKYDYNGGDKETRDYYGNNYIFIDIDEEEIIRDVRDVDCVAWNDICDTYYNQAIKYLK